MFRLLLPKFWTIQVKLTVSFFLVLLISNGVITYLFYNNSVNQIYIKLSQSTQKTVLQVNKTIDFYIRDIERLSLSVFADPLVQRVLRDPAQDKTQQLQNDSDVELRLLNLSMVRPNVIGIYIYSLDGHIYYQTKGNTPALDYKVEQEPWYTKVKENMEEKYFLIPTSWETHTYMKIFQTVSLVRRISDTTVTRSLGYMKIDTDLDALDSIVSSVRTNEVSRVVIISSDHKTLLDTALKYPEDLSNKHFVNRVTAEESGQFREIVDGIEQLIVFHRSPYTGWTVAAMLPISTMNKENKQIRNSVILIACIMIGLSSLFAYWISNNLTKRIRSLKRMMVKAEMGQFDVRVEDTSSDEVGNLTMGFNSMLRNIDELIHQNYILQLKEAESQMQALQAQINPHFLYNTLNVMRSISNYHGVSVVAKMVEVLSDMFRYSIMKDSGYVELNEELEQVKRYLFIQNIRFDHLFTLETEVPDLLLKTSIVRQTLQPIVENSIIHGLENMDEPGKLLIRAHREGSKIIVMIIDNGVGIEPERLRNIQEGLSDAHLQIWHSMPNQTRMGTGMGTGMGIRNVHQRLQLRFGKEYGLSIDSVYRQGTTVSLYMPYLETVADDRK